MRGRSWNKEDCFKLIAAYKKRPVLYNKAHPDYNSTKERENAFMFIVDELQSARPGTLLPEVKKRITNLRTQYFKQKRCVEEAAKRGETFEGRLWCYKDMQFIEDETILEDPLDMTDDRNSTWFPDIDEDSLSELSYSGEADNEKPVESEFLNESGTSQQSVELLDDIQTSVAHDEVSSMYISEQVEILESEDETLADNGINITKNATSPETPKVKTKTRKRRTQKSPHLTPDNNPITSKKCKNSIETTSFGKNLADYQHIKELENRLSQLDNVTSKAFELIGNNTDSEEAHNRAFIENLIYDLDELPDDILQRVKWQITNEVYAAFNDRTEVDKLSKKGTDT